MTITYSLQDRDVLITGANRGLGRALLEEALRRGAATVYAATRGPFDHPDDRVVRIELDLAEPDSIQAAAQTVDRLDVLINNAAIGSLGEDLTDVPLVLDHLKVNVLGPLSLTNELADLLAAARGRLVNIGSITALANLPVMPSYSISKAAAMSLAQAQRAMLGQRGIGVHLVLAGPIDTDMSEHLEIPKTAPDEVAAAILDGVTRGDEEIFPDPLSAPIADGWETGLTKTMEQANAALLPSPGYRTTVEATKSPAEVYDALTDPASWWDGEITGTTDQIDREFTYRHATDHVSLQRVTELVPERRVVWEVLSSSFGFVDEPDAWAGTQIVFELEPTETGTRLTFTHDGLVPALACYEFCSAGWDHVIERSLRQYIQTGTGLAF